MLISIGQIKPEIKRAAWYVNLSTTSSEMFLTISCWAIVSILLSSGGMVNLPGIFYEGERIQTLKAGTKLSCKPVLKYDVC